METKPTEPKEDETEDQTVQEAQQVPQGENLNFIDYQIKYKKLPEVDWMTRNV